MATKSAAKSTAKKTAAKDKTKKDAPQDGPEKDESGKGGSETPSSGSGGGQRLAIAAAVIAVAAVVAVILMMNLGAYGKAAVEKLATASLGVAVSIDSLDVSLQERRVMVKGVQIANPEGYEASPYAMRFEQIAITTAEISKDLLVFDNIRVDGAAVNLEVKEWGTNLTEITDHVNSKASLEHESAQEPTRVIVRELLIGKAALRPASTLLKNEMEPVTMPEIRIRGLGEEENGVIASQAMTQILGYVVQVAAQSSLRGGFLQGMAPEALADFEPPEVTPGTIVDRMLNMFEN